MKTKYRLRQRKVNILGYNTGLVQKLKQKKFHQKTSIVLVLFLLFQILSPFGSFFEKNFAKAVSCGNILPNTATECSNASVNRMPSNVTFTMVSPSQTTNVGLLSSLQIYSSQRLDAESINQSSVILASKDAGSSTAYSGVPHRVNYVEVGGTNIINVWQTDGTNDTRLDPGKDYIIALRFYDYLGVEKTETPGFTTRASVPPTVVASKSINVDFHTICLYATVTDNNFLGINKVEFYVDGALKYTSTSVNTQGNYGVCVGSEALNPGTHSVKMIAYDKLGATTTNTNESFITYALTTSVSPSNSGNVEWYTNESLHIREDGALSFPVSSNVQLFARPASGYVFDHWEPSSCDYYGNQNTNSIVTLNGNLTCTAYFAVESPPTTPPTGGGTTYTLSVIGGNGGEVSKTPSQTSYNAGSSVTLSASANTNYTFSSWTATTDPGATCPVASTTSATTTITMNGNYACLANFTSTGGGVTTYTLSYNANGGTGAPNSSTHNASSTTTVSNTTPTRSGYTFNSWNTNSSGTGTNYAPGSSITLNSNITLYAKWTQNSTPTFDITPTKKSIEKNGAVVSFGSTLPSNAGSGFNLSITSATSTSKTLPSGKSALIVYDITPSVNLTGTYAATISLTYPSGKTYKAGDTVMYWDTTSSSWKSDGISAISGNGNTITFTTNHFTEFAILTDSTTNENETGATNPGNGTATGGTGNTTIGGVLPTTGSTLLNAMINFILAIGGYLLIQRYLKKSRYGAFVG